jgi:FkbM family methyltransferase
MISYAQNAEDVRLERVFHGGERGFYVDVGAYDPVHCSMTKHFYDRGWRGINVEPSPASFARVSGARPRDVNVNAGVSDAPGELAFFDFPPEHAGLSTFSREIAMRHRADGYTFTERKIPVRTLASICEEHVRGPIDFMSIDVEGYEDHVLGGADFERFRPRVLVIEATEPKTTVASQGKWEHLLTAARYEFAAFDGLNRYYVPAELAGELAPLLARPMSHFDEHVRWEIHRELEELRKKVGEYEGAETPLVKLARGIERVARRVGRRVLARRS